MRKRSDHASTLFVSSCSPDGAGFGRRRPDARRRAGRRRIDLVGASEGAGRPLRIRDEQARQITGAYGLSNGWYLKVHTEPRYIVARIDDDAPIRLYAVAPYRFVSQDSKVAMEFNRGPGGEDMLMSYVPETGLAWVEVASSPLARR